MDIISDLMEWDDSEATREFDWLKVMVDYKFDRYQGYGPGVHFYISLIHWLGQFQDVEARKAAYRYLRHHLVFVGQSELHQLIKLAMPEMEKDARRLIAKRQGISYFETWTNAEAKRALRLMSLRTLYVGLSDGARVDVFRRDNDGLLTNEQVVASSEISNDKWGSLGEKLKDRLKQSGFPEAEQKFERVCLIDDFTGSGSTLIRPNGAGWDGKVFNFCRQNNGRAEIASQCHVQIHHYLASSKAESTIKEALTAYQATISKFGFNTSYSWILSPSPYVVIGAGSDPDLIRWIDSHYDPSIETTHNCKDGKPIALGYKQCGLPIVLEHNTPNNTIALMWATSKNGSTAPHQMRPLFPRIDRHIDNGQSV
jgi:hypothetical protein